VPFTTDPGPLLRAPSVKRRQYLLLWMEYPEVDGPFGGTIVEPDRQGVPAICGSPYRHKWKDHRHELVLARLGSRVGHRLEAGYRSTDSLVADINQDLELMGQAELLRRDVDQNREIHAKRCGHLRAPEPGDPSTEDVQEPLADGRRVAKERRGDVHWLGPGSGGDQNSRRGGGLRVWLRKTCPFSLIVRPTNKVVLEVRILAEQPP
jgi:hypothetical protein